MVQFAKLQPRLGRLIHRRPTQELGETMMTPQYASVAELRQTISIEVLVALGLPRTGVLQALLRPVVWPPAQRFSRLAAEFDRRTALFGFTAAMRWAVPLCVQDVRAEGAERIPATGPLVVVSNHPGSYDGLLIGSLLDRDDLKVVVTDVPFLRSLYGIAPHLIYTPKDPHTRMATARESVRHLRAGGALMIFPSGLVDPDPEVLPGAEKELDSWSKSLDLVMRRVPETKIIITIASGVLSPICLHNPLTRLRKKEWEQRKLAEFLQVIQQLVLKRKFGLSPRLTFDVALNGSELLRQSSSSDLHQAILWRAHQVLQAHMEAASRPG